MNYQNNPSEAPRVAARSRWRRDGKALPGLLIGAALVAVILRSANTAEAIHSVTNKPACCVTNSLGTGPVSDTSLYQLDSNWTNDAGAVMKLAALSGRPQIVTMFFAKCEYACPVLINDMKRIEAALPANLRTNVGFVLVSFDTERDVPKALAHYRRQQELAGHWTLLTAQPDDVLELAALLGVKFKKDARGQFAHSNVITVLNTKGEIVLQQMGLNRDSAPAVAALKKLL